MFMFSETAVTVVGPLLRSINAETAHRLAIRALASGIVQGRGTPDAAALGSKVLGQFFPNPLGLAAGFDKDAEAVLPLMKLGFGFVETGTVTRLPQEGNPRPRLFRLPADRAVINRMGFNNAGIDQYCGRLARLGIRPCPLGANVGLNKNDANAERDYPALIAAVSAYADYVTINVSSPNTPGLRALQDATRLRAILRAVRDNVPVRPPVIVKLAPDLAEGEIETVVQVAIEEDAAGLIVGNTTIARPRTLKSRNATQQGGLSGAPLFARSTEMLAQVARLARGRLVLIGCGGVRSGADVLAKIKTGASLVQIYTEFAYAGPVLVPRIKSELLAALRRDGFASVSDAVGADL